VHFNSDVENLENSNEGSVANSVSRDQLQATAARPGGHMKNSDNNQQSARQATPVSCNPKSAAGAPEVSFLKSAQRPIPFA
jgi:hypothetical protein